MAESGAEQRISLLNQAGIDDPLQLDSAAEHAWIEVIHKMDSVYADLVHYQVELEEKNAALEQANQFIDSVLASMTDVLIVCDTRGVIQQVNSALEKLSGKPARTFVGQPVLYYFPESTELATRFPLAPGKEILSDCEVNFTCENGTTLALALNGSARFDQRGVMEGMVLLGRPIGELRRAYDELHQAHRELKQTQQQLVQSEKMASLGRLVAGVAHELNNPISFVFGNMHALKRYGTRLTRYLEAVSESSLQPHLAQLYEELKIGRILQDMDPLIDGTLEGAERVSVIVQELRRYSGGQTEASVRFDLATSIRKAVQWVVQANRSSVTVHYHLQEALETISCSGKLHQILVNLTQNGLDAMSHLPHPVLHIFSDSCVGKLHIRIVDSGTGIPDQHLSHIFDPFFTSKPVGQGTGLGLYISYGLAQELGGELQARNHQDGGAEFILTLPDTLQGATTP